MQTHIILHKKLISGKAELLFAKSGPNAVLQRGGHLVKRQCPLNQRRWPFYEGRGPFSRLPISSAPILLGPMAVLSRQKQPNRQTSRFEPRIADSSLSRAINAEPSHFFSKLQFYQCQAQWPFYQSRSNQMARPLDFSHKLQFRYYPAQSTYQRPGKAIFSQSQPNGRCITWPLYQGRSS